MVKLPPAPMPTVDAIYSAYETDQGDGFREHLGASLIGKPCERALWYDFRWVTVSRHEGRILRLTFLGADTYAPLLGRVARQAGVDYNILSGRIDRIRETPYGQLVVALVGGDADAAQRAFADAGVTVEVLRP